MLKLILLIAAGILVGLGVIAVVRIGPSNVIGMLRYDTRHEGRLKVGDRAPDVALVRPDGSTGARLLAAERDRPLVIVFGSFT
jgi:hypothetical protein